MSELLRDPRFLIILVVLGMFTVVVAATWGDTCRAVAEFFAPLKRVRFRFSLRSLLLFTTLVAVLLKLGIYLEWLRGWTQLDKLGGLAVGVIVLGAAGLVISFYLSACDRRQRIDQSREILTDDGQPAFPANGKNTRKKPKRLRFTVRKRPTTGFKW